MDECRSIKTDDVLEVESIHGKLPFPYPPKDDCIRCNNLLVNPSFETCLDGWVACNTFPANNPFEGTQTASLGPGVASIYQDVSLAGLKQSPLFLSFEVLPLADPETEDAFVGDVVVKVEWLDEECNPIATGLRLLIIQRDVDDAGSRLTYFDITDQPPKDAAWARLQFSKEAGLGNSTLQIDQVILTAIASINLVQNPSFELGLTDWDGTDFSAVYSDRFEGIASALAFENGGTLIQDVSIAQFPDNSSFLLSFAASSGLSVANLNVVVNWLDSAGNVIGTGLELSIRDDTLGDQPDFLTYLDITDPAPDDAVKARIIFTAEQLLAIDKVIFARVKTPNLVENPSFEDGQQPWIVDNTMVTNVDDAYEGSFVVRVPGEGGMLFQDIPIREAEGHCFLLNFGFRSLEGAACNTLAEVRWLDRRGNEIGLGLSIVIPRGASGDLTWLVYSGITEPAPFGTAKARVQFTKAFIGPGNFSDIDKVVFGRLV